MKRLLITLIIALLNQGCAGLVGVTGVAASLAPEAEQAHQKRLREKELREIDRYNYDAFLVETDELVCAAGDKPCHDALVANSFRRSAESCGTAFRNACTGPEVLDAPYYLKWGSPKSKAKAAQLDAYAKELDAAIAAMEGTR